jgi:DNA-binding response OmpR family regulator
MSEQSLLGIVILVVEDEYYAADDLRRELTRLGAQVIGPASNLEMALELIEGSVVIHAAILDINLGGEMVFPAADRLKDKGVPFLFATGYDQSVIPSRFSHIPRCEKPVAPEKLASALTIMISKQ